MIPSPRHPTRSLQCLVTGEVCSYRGLQIFVPQLTWFSPKSDEKFCLPEHHQHGILARVFSPLLSENGIKIKINEQINKTASFSISWLENDQHYAWLRGKNWKQRFAVTTMKSKILSHHTLGAKKSSSQPLSETGGWLLAPPNISDISVSSSAREDFLCLVLLPVCCKDQSVQSNLTTNALREVIVTVNWQ